jgi:WD40 repeat protein
LTESERHLRDERNRALQARAEAEAARDTAETARRDAEAAQEREEAQGYLARIGLASEKIADNAFGDALRILQAYATGKQASRRHWEWGRLRWLCALDSLSVEAEDRVESLAVAPGGKWVVTGHGDGGVRIWEAQQAGPPRRRLQLAHPVLALAISPDAQFLAAADGARIQLWQLDQGDQADAPRHTLSGHRDDVLSLAFAPQGDRLLSGARDGASALWRWPSDGAPAHVVGGHHGPVWSVAFAPDGQSFLTASEDAKVILWQIANPSKKIFRGHRSAVYCAAFSPDGRYIASGDYDGRVLVWEPNLLAEDIVALQRRLDAGPSGSRPPDGTRRDDVLPPHLNANSATGPQNDDAGVRVLAGHTDAVRSIVFARDGRWVLSGSHDHTVRAWNWSQDLQERNAVRILRGHGGWVRACAFLRDGNAAVSAGDDRQLKYWDIHSYEERRVLEGHRDAILRAAFAPDGQTLVTASRDHAARLWGVADRRSTRLEEGHAYLAQRALFTQDGKMLLTAAFDNTVLKWDRATGGQMPFETAQRLEGVGRNGVMALSHDGQWLLTASDENAARLWDARTGRLLQTLEGHRDEVTAVAFAPGDALAFTGDAKGRGLLWRRADASGPWQQAAELQGHRQGLRINAARFLPDGRRLLTASADHTVAQWDVVRAEEQKPLVLAHPDAVTLLAVAPSGQLALTACADRRVRLWDVDRAVSVILDNGQARPENERIDAVAFAPDGRQALVLWGGAQELQLYAWPAVPALEEAPTRRVLRGPFGAASAALFTPEGTQVLTVGGDGARLWNVQAGLQRVATYRPHGAVSAADFSSDGRYVLTGGWDGAVKIWDLHQTPPVVILKLENPHAGRAVQAAVFSPGARSLAQQRILTVGDDGTAKLWDVDLPGKRYALHAVQKPHSLCIRSAAFAPDGSWIVTASDDGTAKLWPAEGDGAAIVLRGHRQPVLSAAFAPATSAGSARPLVVTGSSDRTAIVWQIDWQQKTATAQTVLAGGHTASVLAVAFSPDGRRVLTGGEDNLAKLWETSSGREILTLKYHRQEVTAVAFSPDGRLALTASGDGEAVLWPALDWCPDAEVPP